MGVVVLIALGFALVMFPTLRCALFHPVSLIRFGTLDLIDHFKHHEYDRCGSGELVAYTGLFGKGKTLSAVHKVVSSYKQYNGKKVWCPRRGRMVEQRIKVISNVALSIPYEDFVSLEQIVVAAERNKEYDDEHGTLTVTLVLGDEFSVQMNSRNFKTNIDPLFLNTILTCRHYYISLYYTAQRFGHVDALLTGGYYLHKRGRKVMKSSISENVILFDWLTVSCKEEDPWYWVTILHMEDVAWSAMEKGRHGYRNGLYFGSISILYDGNPGMGICLDMSGQGCRAFEEYGSGDFIGLFQLFQQDDRFNITRLDVAFDDHTGVLNIYQLFRDTDKHGDEDDNDDEIVEQQFISKFRKSKIEKEFDNGRPGITIYHGSKSSDVLIRIYDKAAERGLPKTEHWVRVELQLRRERASQFAFTAVTEPIGTLFRGVLVNYVRYVDDPGSDSNRWRWPMKSYWAELIEQVGRISLFVKPGIEYNIRQLDHYVFDQAVNAIGASIDIYGAPFFMEQIQERRSDNPKYKRLVEQYGKQQSAMRAAFRSAGGVPGEAGPEMDRASDRGGGHTPGAGPVGEEDLRK